MELKPCPFCGGKANFLSYMIDGVISEKDLYEEHFDAYIGCSECSCQYVRGGDDAVKLSNGWNTRKPDDLAAEKRRLAERLFFALLEKRGNGSNDLRSIEALIERSKRAAEHFFGGE